MKTNVKAETSHFLKPKDYTSHRRTTPRKRYTKAPLKFAWLFSQRMRWWHAIISEILTTEEKAVDSPRAFRAVIRNVPCFSCSWGSRMHNSVSFSFFFLLKNGVAGRERNASSQTASLPLSSSDIHERWQPVTQSSRSRWSYGKIGDCEQSRCTRK